MVLMWKRAFSGIKNAVMINQVPVRCNWGEGIFRIVLDPSDVRQASTVMHERKR